MEHAVLESTSWTTTKIAPNRFNISTTITRRCSDGTVEQVQLSVVVDGAQRLTGAEAHTAALLRAKAIIDEAIPERKS